MEGLFRFFSEKERMGEGTDKASTHDEGHDNNEAQYKQENVTTVIVGRRRVMFEFVDSLTGKNEFTDSNERKHSKPMHGKCHSESKGMYLGGKTRR